MAKIFSVVPLELLPNVKGEDFEQFWTNEYGPQGSKIGWIAHLLKADRGERAGQYAVIWEMPSVESRDRIMPAEGGLTDEGRRLLEPEFSVLGKKLNTFVTGWPYTHYIELGS